jgi:hypothetical protein
MFGIGAPDWGTIPAYISEISNARYDKISINVTNFGQGYWISSQSVMQLIQEIKSGNIPDIVIFYDGLNDTGSATVSRQADTPLIQRYETPYGESPSPLRNFLQLCTSLNSVRVARLGIEVIHGYIQPEASKTRVGEELDINKTSESICSIYLHNLDIVAALSKDDGFGFYLFWQPWLMIES